MKCVTCKTSTMEGVAVDPALTVQRCATCQGMWIAARRYWSFLNEMGRTSAADEAGTAADSREIPIHDSTGVKLCPECAHFMHRFEVGHGLAFAVDRCSACGGFWLDANEWQALAVQKLHAQLHLIASESWQREIDRQKREDARQRLLLEKLGPADYAKAQRVKIWLDSHAHKAELYAYLLAEDEDEKRNPAGFSLQNGRLYHKV